MIAPAPVMATTPAPALAAPTALAAPAPTPLYYTTVLYLLYYTAVLYYTHCTAAHPLYHTCCTTPTALYPLYCYTPTVPHPLYCACCTNGVMTEDMKDLINVGCRGYRLNVTSKKKYVDNTDMYNMGLVDIIGIDTITVTIVGTATETGADTTALTA
jgi:hypothetical protein